MDGVLQEPQGKRDGENPLREGREEEEGLSRLCVAWDGTLPAQRNDKISLCLSLLNTSSLSPRLSSITPARGMAANSGKPQQMMRQHPQ